MAAVKSPQLIIHSADNILLLILYDQRGSSENSNIHIRLIFFHTNVYVSLCLDNASFCIDYPVENCKITVFPFGSILADLKGH